MSKKRYDSVVAAKQPQRPKWLLPAIVVGIFVIVIGALAFILGGRREPFEPKVTGGPSAEVETTSVDLGDMRVNTLAESAFKIRNVGDQPLMILGEPRIDVIEGC